ncbi:MAG: pyridoxal phosphate-dependent aminotransferase [Hyphomicrobiales bacterium]
MENRSPDLLEYYTCYFREGMADISRSNPPPFEVEVPCGQQDEGLEYVPPTGAAELREAIARRYRTVHADEVVLAAGASEALAAIGFAFTRPGGCVTADRGTYPSFTEAVTTAGGQLAVSSGPVPGAMLAAICNPTVPDGRLVDAACLARQAAACGAVLVADEVYRDLVPSGSPAPAAADCDERAMSVGGLSKPLGLGGLRIGWIATHDAALRERLDRQLQLLSGGPAGPSVSAAVAAFERYNEAVDATLTAATTNAPAVYGALERAGWTFREPEAGLTIEAWPPAPPGPCNEQRVRDAGIFLVPCSVYGTPGSYRISLLADRAALERALTLLAGRC